MRQNQFLLGCFLRFFGDFGDGSCAFFFVNGLLFISLFVFFGIIIFIFFYLFLLTVFLSIKLLFLTTGIGLLLFHQFKTVFFLFLIFLFFVIHLLLDKLIHSLLRINYRLFFISVSFPPSSNTFSFSSRNCRFPQ
jgi:hypothetical protein